MREIDDVINFMSTVFEKLIVTQLVKKFPAFYGNRRFITVFRKNNYAK
jgi:hypothetical protein